MEQSDQKEHNNLGEAVRAACTRLQSAYLQAGDNNSKHAARATLANLRKGAGQSLTSNPLMLEKVLSLFEPGLHPGALGKTDDPSSAEVAATSALTLFAWHMQSTTQPVHNSKVSFAQACGALHARSESKSIKPRIDAMLLADSDASRLIHLRSVISLLRTQGMSFDYGRFASDLEKLSNAKTRPGVQLRWGRDLIRGLPKATTATAEDS